MKLFALLTLAVALAASASPASAGESPETVAQLDFIYRDGNDIRNRLVTFQGARSQDKLVQACGDTGARCQCLFFRDAVDPDPLVQESTGFSAKWKNLQCQIPANGLSPALYRYGQLRDGRTGRAVTGRLRITTSLKLEDVIGGLNKSKVRGVYRYSCSRTFFEGEGVSPTEVACPAGQRLGIISASYAFYLFNSQSETNLHEKGSDSVFENPICNRQFLKVACNTTPELRWGLYAEQADVFERAVTLVANPEGANAASVYGYFATPDVAGNCPVGMIRVQQWLAQPQSITQGSIDGTNPPSSFVNGNNSLSNQMVEASQPENFTVVRQKNQVPCASEGASPGDCTNATFAGASVVQSATYSGLTPIVCAIPKELLTGLF